MKRFTKILFGIVTFVVVPVFVHAETIMACDPSRVFNVAPAGSIPLTLGGGAPQNPYTMNFYDTTTAGISGLKTYCMSPAQRGGADAAKTVFYCDRVVDPSDNSDKWRQAYDVALTKAYQTLLSTGHANNPPTQDDRVIGELVFRWLSYNFNQGDNNSSFKNPQYAAALKSMFLLDASGQPMSYWNTGDPRYNVALDVYRQAQAAGNEILAGKTYDDLVMSGPGDTDGKIWGDVYNQVITSTTNGDSEVYTIKIDADSVHGPSHIYWDMFTGGCTNSTVTCSATASGSGSSGQIVITVKKNANYDGQAYGLYYDSAYYDIRSASSNILLLKPASRVNGYTIQNMLVAVDGKSEGTPITYTRRRHPVYTDRCIRDNNKFYYVNYRDGVETSRREVTNEDEMVRLNCPIYCTMLPDGTRTEDRYSWASADQYSDSKHFFNHDEYNTYCDSLNYSCHKDGNINHCGPEYMTEHPGASNDECTQDEYNHYCPGDRSCTHDSSGYYDRSGNATDANTFYEQCCDQLDPGSEEYQINCGCGEPNIDFKFACQEFNSDDEHLNSTVSDTKDNASLKYCLFGARNTDKANNSFEMTDQTTVVNNPYCKVSCVEKVDFLLPNATYTESGGYFTLDTTVTAERKCYVNASADNNYDGIDYAKFKQDLKEEITSLMSNYTEYLRYKTALETAGIVTSRSESADGLTNSYPCSTGTCGCNSYRDCTATIWYVKAFTFSGVSASFDGNNNLIALNTPTVSQGEGLVAEDGSATDASSCGSSGQCVDGSESVIRNALEAQKNTYQTAYETNLRKIKELIRQINDCSAAISNSDDLSSAGWENQFNFDPLIEFEYDEPYQTMPGFNNKFEEVDSTEYAPEYDYCTGDVGNTYNCNGSDTVPTTSSYWIDCNTTSCTLKTYNLSTARYIVKSRKVEATYAPKNHFSIYTPSGTIALNKDNYVLYTGLCGDSEECLPIALNTPTGVFNFKFKYSNLGQYNDNNSNGRLIGTGNSVFNASTNLQTAGYVCQYVNNCPECDYVCEGTDCDISDHDNNEEVCDGECTYDCLNCIFDGKNNTFYYRTVSVHSLFPSSRDRGPNWNNEKGEYTLSQIEGEGENVYRDPEYSYEINPIQMNRIREFNRSVGNYMNTLMDDNSTEALHCESYNSPYQNLVCYSTFLDTPGNKYFTELVRNDEWILWPDSGYYQSATQYSVVNGLGPAWK